MALDRERLARILGMLGSEHDGEVVAAARQAERMRKAADLSWADILGGSNHTEARYQRGPNPFQEAWERGRQDREWRQEQQEAHRRRQQEQRQRDQEARERAERMAREAAADAAFEEAADAWEGRDDEAISEEEARKIDNRIKAASFAIGVARKFPMRFSESEKLFLEMVKTQRGKISENQVEQLRRIFQKARVYAQ